MITHLEIELIKDLKIYLLLRYLRKHLRVKYILVLNFKLFQL